MVRLLALGAGLCFIAAVFIPLVQSVELRMPSSRGSAGKRSVDAGVNATMLFKRGHLEDMRLRGTDQYDGDGVVNMCFFCDSACRQKMWQTRGCNMSPDDFFEDVINESNQMLASLGVDFVLRHHKVVPVLYYNFVTDFTTLSGGESGQEGLENVMDNFFSNNLMATLKAGGCEATYLMGDFSERQFSALTGLAYMFSMCTENSFGVAKLSLSSVAHQALILTHEIGHMVGAYHDDGKLKSDYVSMESTLRDKLGDDTFQQLQSACDDPNSSCQASTGSCIMEAIIPSYTISTMFSQCSQRYAAMWPRLAAIWPSFYDTSCALTSSKRTSMLMGVADPVYRDIDSQIHVLDAPPAVDIEDAEVESFSLADAMSS